MEEIIAILILTVMFVGVFMVIVTIPQSDNEQVRAMKRLVFTLIIVVYLLTIAKILAPNEFKAVIESILKF